MVKMNFLFMCAILCCTLGISAYEIPENCFNAHVDGEIRMLSDWYRSSGFDSSSDPKFIHQCDRILEEGWYMIDSPAGNDMPTSKPGLGACGTQYPVWLKDTPLPTNFGEEVDGLACEVSFAGDCVSEYEIKIRNCGERNAYYLIPTSSCPSGYCFGTESPCPEGQTSVTGFTPGCTESDAGDPVLTSAALDWIVKDFDFEYPDITVTSSQIFFRCAVEPVEQNWIYDVVFSVNDVPLVHGVFHGLSFQQLPALFLEAALTDDEHLGYGYELQCHATARQTGSSIISNEVSDQKFYGFTVTNVIDNHLEIKEGDSVDLTIEANIPIFCPLQACPIHVEVHIPSFVKNQICDTSTPITAQDLKLVSTNKCYAMLDETTKQGDLRLTSPVNDLVKDNQQFRIDLQSYETKDFNRAFQNSPLAPLTVVVVDTTYVTWNRQCRVYADPHMLSTDGKYFEAQAVGEFVLYKHTELPQEVRVFFEEVAGQSWTRMCAVFVRSGGDMFVVDSCGNRNENYYLQSKRLPLREGVIECDGKTLHIHRMSDTYDITFPTGTKISITKNVEPYGYNLAIKPSSLDYKKTKGLCGNFDGNKDNDLTTPGGNLELDEEKFTISWRVEVLESYYQGLPPDTEILHRPVHCGCAETGGSPNVHCSTAGAASPCYDKMKKDITDAVYARCEWTNKRRKKRSLGDLSPHSGSVQDEENPPFVYDPNFTIAQPQWKEPWTEESAREFCTEYIENRDSVKACNDTVEAISTEKPIEDCMADIKITGGTEFAGVQVDGIIGKCLDDLRGDPDLWVNSTEGAPMLPTAVTDVTCPMECYNRGKCVNGECICNEGFSGIDCFKNDSAVPTIFRLPNGGKCDLLEWTCEATEVYADGITEEAESFRCKIVSYKIHQSGLVQIGEKILNGSAGWPGRAECKLHEDIAKRSVDAEKVLGHAYYVSVSNNGKDFGNTKPMVVYDSKCSNCSVIDDTVLCDENLDICVIDGRCYEDGEINSADSCQMCDISRDQDNWSERVAGTVCKISGTCYEHSNVDGVNTCLVCNTSINSTNWTLEAGFCLISGSCINENGVNLEEPCQRCDTSISTSEWSDRAGCGTSETTPTSNESSSIPPTPTTSSREPFTLPPTTPTSSQDPSTIPPTTQTSSQEPSTIPPTTPTSSQEPSAIPSTSAPTSYTSTPIPTSATLSQSNTERDPSNPTSAPSHVENDPDSSSTRVYVIAGGLCACALLLVAGLGAAHAFYFKKVVRGKNEVTDSNIVYPADEKTVTM